MATVFQCDRCGEKVGARHFLMNVFWKPVGAPYEHEKFTEYELCPDCIDALFTFVEGAKNTEQQVQADPADSLT